MLKIDTAPVVRHLVGGFDNVIVTVIGVGGTGSAAAPRLAQLLYDLNRRGIDGQLVLVDPDVVEERNVGRQQFSLHEIGRNKAVSMAQRLTAWLGIRTYAIPAPIAAANRRAVASTSRHTLRLDIGCVDNWEARAAVRDRQTPASSDYYLDAGNDRFSGSLFIGNGRNTVINALGVAETIAHPHVQMPALFEAPPADDSADTPEPLDCALGMDLGMQSLAINTVMGALIMQIAYDLLVRRELTYQAVHVNLGGGITAACMAIRAGEVTT